MTTGHQTADEAPRAAGSSALVRHLCMALACIAGLIVAVHIAAPHLSGLTRDDFEEEVSNGLVHPTSAGATASLGVVLLVGACFLWKWSWSRKVLVPGL